MLDDNLRIPYIVGWGRSESTIIGNTLGQCEEFTHVGELLYLWEDIALDKRLCCCGEPFSDCVFFKQGVRNDFESIMKPIYTKQMIRLYKRFTRMRNLPWILFTKSTPASDPDFQRYTNGLLLLFRSIQNIAGTNYFIDTSKLSAYTFILSRAPGFHLLILYLIRDSRGTTYSWKKHKFDPAQNRYMIQ